MQASSTPRPEPSQRTYSKFNKSMYDVYIPVYKPLRLIKKMKDGFEHLAKKQKKIGPKAHLSLASCRVNKVFKKKGAGWGRYPGQQKAREGSPVSGGQVRESTPLLFRLRQFTPCLYLYLHLHCTFFNIQTSKKALLSVSVHDDGTATGILYISLYTYRGVGIKRKRRRNRN